jgi:release factor glutamine methyltransferase
MVVEETWTTLKILAWTKDFLISKGIANARLEAEWLLCSATGLDRVGLYLHFDKPLNVTELASYRLLIARRARREPLQHILGSQEFFGLDYEVTPDVLIPRHDTELLVSEAISRRPDARTVLDIGTGSGCVAITLQKKLPLSVVTATDISEAALIVARRNATRHDLNISFKQGSLFSPVSGSRFDLIVSNPPYICTADIDSLECEVRDYDPITALDGGADGLHIYRLLIPLAVDYLSQSGFLIVEIGAGQKNDIGLMFSKTGKFHEPFVSLDTNGTERVIGAQLKEKL